MMLGSEKAPPFLDAYKTTKMEAEQYIIDECPNLKPVFLRPGFIWDSKYRWWSVPLHYAVDLAWYVGDLQKNLPFSRSTDFLYPAKSVRLSTVAHFCQEGVMGNLGNEQVFANDILLKFEAELQHAKNL